MCVLYYNVVAKPCININVIYWYDVTYDVCVVWYLLPSVLWHCWLVVRKSIRPVKIDWCGVGVVICLERDADCLHMIQLMPLHPRTLSSLASLKSGLVLPFWYRLTQVVLEKRPLNGCGGSSSILMWYDFYRLKISERDELSCSGLGCLIVFISVRSHIFCMLLCRLLNYACQAQIPLPTSESLLNSEIAWLKKVRVSCTLSFSISWPTKMMSK